MPQPSERALRCLRPAAAPTIMGTGTTAMITDMTSMAMVSITAAMTTVTTFGERAAAALSYHLS